MVRLYNWKQLIFRNRKHEMMKRSRSICSWKSVAELTTVHGAAAVPQIFFAKIHIIYTPNTQAKHAPPSFVLATYSSQTQQVQQPTSLMAELPKAHQNTRSTPPRLLGSMAQDRSPNQSNPHRCIALCVCPNRLSCWQRREGSERQSTAEEIHIGPWPPIHVNFDFDFWKCQILFFILILFDNFYLDL